MAIYSCNLASIGRTTHRAGTAGAYIRYISREGADPITMSNHIPDDPIEGRTWMDQRERAMRKNARVLDKIRIALPRELTEDERYKVVQDFMFDLTGNKIPWYAAIHQTGKDAHNPHVHIAVHDRDIESGRRLLRLSDSTRDRVRDDLPGPKAVEWVRTVWEYAANRALERAGHSERIDRRTLEAQGIDREPTIHEGPRASHINDNVHRPESRPKTNALGRVIDYPKIDKGQTRREFNAHIIDLNLERAARSDNPQTAVWAQFERQQIGLDDKLEARLIAAQQKRTAQYRNTSGRYQARYDSVRAEAKLKHRTALKKVQDKFTPRRDTLRQRQQTDRAALRGKQSTLRARILKAIDITGGTRRRQEEARKELSRRHKTQRAKLKDSYSGAKQAALRPLTEKYRHKLTEIKTQRSTALKTLKSAHGIADAQADSERQQRETDREQSRRIAESKIQNWQREHKTAKREASLKNPRGRAAPCGEDFKQAVGDHQQQGGLPEAQPHSEKSGKPAPCGEHFKKAAGKEQDILKKPRRRKARRPRSERHTIRDGKHAISDQTIGKEFDSCSAKDRGKSPDKDKDQEKDILKKKRRRRQRAPRDRGRGRSR